MSDLIDRQQAIDAFEKELSAKYNKRELAIGFVGVESILRNLPPAEPEMVKKILAAGYEGKEVRIFIGGRLFAVRELAQ